ncbi:hypothetical protein SAMN05920897_11474 [Alkalispirochaeta americana]|uniref:Uncharacterized protein n=1 Tax=Alkalispirochaeta americana TaxID=159291 RepID=A0A1N6VDC5_9SPIO|nr:LysM peptidoglycan-binding domain-containing protein [Alkalispirochaeta americana]SIQ75854.1 hypothetical protein SAMN05920897_11474 [Alkalispirochaeta americana]
MSTRKDSFRKEEPLHIGNRLFRVDEECYVVYMGSQGYGVRPFLRIGTSSFLPEQIKRHIGSVVLTDHLTGDIFLEEGCLDPHAPGRARYVGSPALVEAVKAFVHKEQISSQPLESVSHEAPAKGGQVILYEDGSLRLFLDGHRLFDLKEQERSDRHALYCLNRLDEIISSSRGAYRREDFQDSGFLVSKDHSLLGFSRGEIFTLRQQTSSIREWAPAMIPFSLISTLAGTGERAAFLELLKWRLATERNVFFCLPGGESPPDHDHESSLAEELFLLLSRAGFPVARNTPPNLPADQPAPVALAETKLRFSSPVPSGNPAEFSGEHPWNAGIAPPILPGVLYRYAHRYAHHCTASERDVSLENSLAAFRMLLRSDLRKELESFPFLEEGLGKIMARTDLPLLDRVCAALWLWNSVTDTSSSLPEKARQELARQARETAQSLFLAGHVPVTACIQEGAQGWCILFSPREGLTRGAVDDNERARQRMKPFLEQSCPRTFFEKERARLKALLEALLAANRVTTPPAPARPDPAVAPIQHQPPLREPGKQEGTALADQKTSSPAPVEGQVPSGGKGSSSSSGSSSPPPAALSPNSSPKRSPGKAPTKPQATAPTQAPPSKTWRLLLGGSAAACLMILALFLFFLPGSRFSGQGLWQQVFHSQETPPAPTRPADTGTPPASHLEDDKGVPRAETERPLPESGDSPAEIPILTRTPDAPGPPTETPAVRETPDTTGPPSRGPLPEEAPTTAPTTAETEGDSPEWTGSTTDSLDEFVAPTPPGEAPLLSGPPPSSPERETPDQPRPHDWSIRDILLATNWIARGNGYAPIGEEQHLSPSPHWIYPGNLIELPDGRPYTIVAGDTLWGIAERFLTRFFSDSPWKPEDFREIVAREQYPIREIRRNE